MICPYLPYIETTLAYLFLPDLTAINRFSSGELVDEHGAAAVAH